MGDFKNYNPGVEANIPGREVMPMPDFTHPGSIICDRVLTVDELAKFPPDTQAMPLRQDGEHSAWSHTNYLIQWGKPTVPMLSFATLGQGGGFGSQLFQYAFTRLFAQTLKRPFCVPDWIGAKLFGLDDPPPVQVYPHYRCMATKIEDSELYKNVADLPPLLDISGGFQFNTSVYAPHKADIREWFKPVQAIEENFGAALRKIVVDRTLVCLQLRRGSGYGKGMYFITDPSVYLDWLASIWPSLKNPVLYVATDDASVLPAFAMYNPLTSKDMGIFVQGAEYYTDFYVLMHAQILAISNSTFGVWAAMLHRESTVKFNGQDVRYRQCLDGSDFIRPRYGMTKLMPFDPWNCDPLTDRDQDKPEAETLLAQSGRQVFGSIVNG